jgi:hypothetical protein
VQLLGQLRHPRTVARVLTSAEPSGRVYIKGGFGDWQIAMVLVASRSGFTSFGKKARDEIKEPG